MQSGNVRALSELSINPQLVIHKRYHSALAGTPLAARLVEMGVTTLIISGIRTEQCCETTTRQAADSGFKVDFVSEATLTFPQTLVLRYTRLEPRERRNPQVAEDYARWFMARLRSVDAALERGDYLCAGRFTAADISVGYALLLARTLGLNERFSPAIDAYWERLAGREGFGRAKAAQASEGAPDWQG